MSTLDHRTTDDPVARRATRAVAAVFVANGFLMSNWATRIPQVRDLLDLSASQLGLLIMCIAAGAVVALPLSGLVVQRWGPRRAVAVGATVASTAMTVVGIGVYVGLPIVAGALFVAGFSIASWDVSQNVEGAAVEHRRSVPLMPRFHAAFSVGTVGGALFGAAMNAVGLPVTPHLVAVAVVCAAVCLTATRSFLPAEDAPATHRGGRALRRAWTERRTLLIGVFALGLSFAEGAGMDWIAVAAVDAYAAPAAVASFAYAVFVCGITAARWFGTAALARFGRVACLRVGVVTSITGVLLAVLGGSLPAFLAGTALWGAGIALGFPVAMSAAADDESMAAPRVSVVSTIGYTAFLAGPALIGFAGDHSDTLRALLLVTAALAMAFAASGAIRRPEPAGQG